MTQDTGSGPDLLDRLAHEFARRFRRGEHPSLTEYTDRYPELATQIRDLFPALAMIEQFGSIAGPPTGPHPRTPTGDGLVPARLGEYRVVRELGRGGMGIVYEAVQESLGRHVALKVLPFPSLADANHLERFRREAQAAARLHHTNIVPVFGVGEHEGVHYFAMQLIHGQPLDGVLRELKRRRGPSGTRPAEPAEAPAPGPAARPRPALTVTLAASLASGRFRDGEGTTDGTDPGEAIQPVDAPGPAPGGSATSHAIVSGDQSELSEQSDANYFRSVARVGVQIAEALAYAHQQGIVHRDIKPANLLLDTHGTVWVTDFGLAKAEGTGELTGTGDLLGTMRYMAPERFRGEADARSDVYSLGLTLYEMVTLRPAFAAVERAPLIERMIHAEPTRPRELDGRLPRDLETIILKAIAKEPARRYQTSADLAADLQLFLADRPIRARRTRWPERFGRWCRHNPALAFAITLAASALLVAVFCAGYLLYDSKLRALHEAQQRLARADDLVDALLTADIREVPRIVERLRHDRDSVRQRLRTLALAGPPEPTGLRAALALLPEDPSLRDDLASRLLVARPDELIIVRQALRDQGYGPDLVPRLWSTMRDRAPRLTERQLRAAGALALLDPGEPNWRTHVVPLVAALIRQDPQSIDAWRVAFEPVATRLTGPLRLAFGDQTRPEEQAVAFRFLLGFATRPHNPERDEDLADLVAEADPAQFRQISDALTDRSRALARLSAKLTPLARFDEVRARRQGRVAAALFVLGQADRIWPLLRHSDDPSVRTEIIHNLAPYRADPRLIIDRIQSEPDVSARRALLLCLGEFEPAVVAPQQEALVPRLLRYYRDEPDSGVHSAIDWLLRRRWGRAEDLDRIDRELRGRSASGHDWHIDAEGQTLAIIRGPLEFHMGSPARESGREYDETHHRVRIDRSFALATREVTVAQFRRSLGRDDGSRSDRDEAIGRHAPTPACPMVGVTWYEAARYCNWLSQQEGFSRDQWCYPDPVGPGVVLPPDYLRRRGYRLPSEAEWEYACRSGAVSSRFFGDQPVRIGEYGWYAENSGGRVHPVGLLKPNDRGLFDMHGNVWEWGQDPFVMLDPAVPDTGQRDEEHPGAVSSTSIRILRGGSFNYQAVYLRSADRDWNLPGSVIPAYGFRVARTWP
jgi:serine/threonine protein kinase/formylglycine-generating enzyme required for sulfatase activity